MKNIISLIALILVSSTSYASIVTIEYKGVITSSITGVADAIPVGSAFTETVSFDVADTTPYGTQIPNHITNVIGTSSETVTFSTTGFSVTFSPDHFQNLVGTAGGVRANTSDGLQSSSSNPSYNVITIISVYDPNHTAGFSAYDFYQSGVLNNPTTVPLTNDRFILYDYSADSIDGGTIVGTVNQATLTGVQLYQSQKPILC